MTTDPELDKILERYGRLISGVAHNLYIDEAKAETETIQAITRWAAKQELRGRIKTLENLHRYDGKDYDTELDEIIDEQIAQLQQELDND